MPDSHESPSVPGLDGLFDDLPTASSPLPEREQRERAAPGSRRAMREAREAAECAQGDERTRGDERARGAAPAPAPAAAPAHRSTYVPVTAQASASDPERSAKDPLTVASEVAPLLPAESSAGAPFGQEGGLDSLFSPERHKPVPPKKRGRGCLIWLIVLLVVLGAIAAGGAWVYSTYKPQIDKVMGWGESADYPAGQASGEATLTILKGDTGSPVSTALYKAGVTKTDRAFYDYLIQENKSVTFYPGVYKLQKKMTAAAALAALQDPKNRMANTVRIAEGGTMASSLPRIVDGVGLKLEDLQAAVKDPTVYGVQAKSLEGWLFPATYTFDPGVTAKDVIQRMVDRTRESLQKAGVPDADAQRVLTIASIIEREARTPDFAKVSRVIENRLADGMKLQMDSTAQYGFGELHAGKASTSKEAQNNDNAWNTYVITGLPATPIASAGDAAIDAAMHPADGPWLYFVTVNMSTGETQFSTTYEEHQQAIKKMQAWCKANPGTGC
ncbi:endolytic transglycosylase MltG [uncultured Microbacterium sp.]|uniref:endolytic transglycosylase MltG n=1 Tax=uncultured Microbacterium sp. TaxID=191216 RepID=UPI00260A36B3|nr:endolytic transglycosylase MltG [uncultured Microbacterium sp.]